jgi:hypothetical protein
VNHPPAMGTKPAAGFTERMGTLLQESVAATAAGQVP